MQDNPIKKSALIIIVIGILMLVMLGVTSCSEKIQKNKTVNNTQTVNYEEKDCAEPIKKYLNGIKDKNARVVASCYPAFYQVSETDMKNIIDNFYENLSSACGTDPTFTFKVIGMDTIPDDDLASLNAEVKKVEANSTKFDEMVVMYTVVEATGSKDKTSINFTFYVGRINGVWYMVM